MHFSADASSGMVEADIVIGSVESGIARLDDYWATSFSQPQPDTTFGGSKDVELISGTEVNGVTTLVFRKPIQSNDIYDRSISKTKSVPIIFAWHSISDALQYHS